MKRCFIVLVLGFYALAASAQDRPNILWLTFEDTSPEFIGCYGNKAAKTPTMDKLAREGTRFTSAYSTGSVCSPSRNALILGCKTYTLGTGNHRSNYPIPDAMTGFPKYLRDAGYYTSNNSKTDYNTSAAKRIIQESWDESSGQAGWWKRQDGQPNAARPFFAVFNSMSSHQSRTMTEPFAQYKKQIIDQLPDSKQTKDEDILLPPFFRDSPAMRKQAARIYNSITKTDTEFDTLTDAAGAGRSAREHHHFHVCRPRRRHARCQNQRQRTWPPGALHRLVSRKIQTPFALEAGRGRNRRKD